jgi:hypothetical protein
VFVAYVVNCRQCSVDIPVGRLHAVLKSRMRPSVPSRSTIPRHFDAGNLALNGLFDCPRLQRNSSFCQVSGDKDQVRCGKLTRIFIVAQGSVASQRPFR